MLKIVFSKGFSVSGVTRKILQKALVEVCSVINYKGWPLEVSLTNITPEEMQFLNNQYRKKNKATDVLSFPLNLKKNFVFIYQKNFLGDIFTCDQVIRQNACAKGHTFEHEYLYMFAHSFLHLLGYDHKTKKNNFLMNKIIKKALTQEKSFYELET